MKGNYLSQVNLTNEKSVLTETVVKGVLADGCYLRTCS